MTHLVLSAPLSVSSSCNGTYDKINKVLKYPSTSGISSRTGECLWNITISEESIINLHFIGLNIKDSLHCVHSYLLIYDETTLSSNILGTKLCGNSRPDNIQSSGSSMQVKFVWSMSNAIEHEFHIKLDVIGTFSSLLLYILHFCY